MASPGQPWQKISSFNPVQDQPLSACYFAIYRVGINHEQRKSLTGSPGQPWQITGPGLAVQAKFGQYLQDTKNPRSKSQTEEAVEWEQV
jgi:hypothetical protein